MYGVVVYTSGNPSWFSSSEFPRPEDLPEEWRRVEIYNLDDTRALCEYCREVDYMDLACPIHETEIDPCMEV